MKKLSTAYTCTEEQSKKDVHVYNITI